MSGLRVIGGTARGRRLKTKKTWNLRPATDFVKEALFNILVTDVIDCQFLDLYAGSGSLGIEAISRGARSAVFVEKDPTHTALIKENLVITGFTAQGKILIGDVLRVIRILKREGHLFDIAFVDPPFRHGLIEPTLDLLLDAELIAPEGLIITRSAFGEELKTARVPVREEKYGVSILKFFRGT